MTVFNDAFDKAAPDGQDDPSEADDNMRRTQAAIQERENVDHFWPLTGTEVSDPQTGEHRKITYQAAISDPTPVALKAHLYMKGGELFYQDDTNTAKQITNAGKLNVVDADGAVVKTGNQTIAGIKTFSSSPIVPAPTTDLQAATKKYIDDRTGLSAYTDEDSATGTLVKGTVYTATGPGFVYATVQLGTLGHEITGKVDGTQVTQDEAQTGANVDYSIVFGVPNGSTFQVDSTANAPTIKWQSIGTLSKPTPP